MNALHGFAFRHPPQQLPRNFRQQRVGQDVVHVARAAFDFRAALRHFVDQGAIVGERDLVVLLDAPLNLAQLQVDDQLHASHRESEDTG